MSIKAQISAVISREEPIQKGGVTAVTDNSIFVSSTKGLKEFQVENPSAYKVGDIVKFQGPNFLGRIPSDLTTKIYVV
jgi:hypothetical protein